MPGEIISFAWVVENVALVVRVCEFNLVAEFVHAKLIVAKTDFITINIKHPQYRVSVSLAVWCIDVNKYLAVIRYGQPEKVNILGADVAAIVLPDETTEVGVALVEADLNSSIQEAV